MTDDIVSFLNRQIGEVRKLQLLNYMMLDRLRNQVSWILRYCRSTNLPFPDMVLLMVLFEKSNEIPDGTLQGENEVGNRRPDRAYY